MATISEEIRGIICDNSKWNYYRNNELSFEYDNLTDVQSCYIFICNYIQSSKKETIPFINSINALRTYKEPNKQEGFRLCHIVSVFFLGLTIFNNNAFKTEIINELSGLSSFDSDDDIEREFIFVWFMICMFHDLGYVFEDEIVSDTYSLTDLQIDRAELIKIIDELQDTHIISDHYEKIMRKYLKYRDNKDHGILGGLSFAKNVCELRDQKYKNARDDNERKMWKPELNELYRFVAWRICCHNIFYIRVGDISAEYVLKYIYHGLYPLMLCNRKTKEGNYVDYPISFRKSPLFFFLCLIDSIDPVKICDGILDDLEISIANNGSFTISSSSSSYMKKIEDLQTWLIPKEGGKYVL